MSSVDHSLSAGNSSPPIVFFYKNWRGEFSYRTVTGTPVFWFGESKYHKGPQWFIKAYDAEKQDVRDFAVADIVEFIK